MAALTPPQLLRIWEAGQAQPPVERALLLLAEAWPGESRSRLEALPIGQRDDRLLRLREAMFGSALAGQARCPGCGDLLELGFSADDLRGGAEPASAAEHALQAGGYDVRFRLPDSADLAALTDACDETQARRMLIARCVLGARRGGRARPVQRLPARVIDAVARRMEALDPQADMHTDLTCPACAHRWQVAFDIGTYLWSEIEAWVRRTLHEVHTLASAYAWSEAEILSLPSWRRQCYLDMVQA